MVKPYKPIINEILDDIKDVIQYEKLDDMNVENLRIYIRKLETQISNMQKRIDNMQIYICLMKTTKTNKECLEFLKTKNGLNEYYKESKEE